MCWCWTSRINDLISKHLNCRQPAARTTSRYDFVSYDRAFLDNVVTRPSPLRAGFAEYAGGYQDWADYQARRRAEEAGQAANRRRNGSGRSGG